MPGLMTWTGDSIPIGSFRVTYGSIIMLLMFGFFRNGLQLGGVEVVWQGFAIGLLVLVAVSLDQWIRKVKT